MQREKLKSVAMRKMEERGRMFYRCHLKERAGVEAACNEL